MISVMMASPLFPDLAALLRGGAGRARGSPGDLDIHSWETARGSAGEGRFNRSGRSRLSPFCSLPVYVSVEGQGGVSAIPEPWILSGPSPQVQRAKSKRVKL